MLFKISQIFCRYNSDEVTYTVVLYSIYMYFVRLSNHIVIRDGPLLKLPNLVQKEKLRGGGVERQKYIFKSDSKGNLISVKRYIKKKLGK